MGDDNGIIVGLAFVLKVVDRVHDGIVALGAASDDGDLIDILRTVLCNDVLSLLNPRSRRENEDRIEAPTGAEFLERMNKNGLIAQIEELLRLIGVPHPNSRTTGKNSSKLHRCSFTS